MASDIDRLINAAMDRLTAPGGPLECETVLRDGLSFPAFKARYAERGSGAT